MLEATRIRLKPAVARNCLITLLVLAAFNLPARAQGSIDIASSAACGGIADPAVRLACYDRTNAPTRTPNPVGPRLQRWPEFNGALAAPGAKPLANAPALSQNRKLAAGVMSFSFSRSHRFTVTLDNGQIWRQLEADDGIAQFRDHVLNRIVISHGFWKSYDLRLNDMSAVFKVQRVK
jgi:hypothetical protein